MGGWPAPHHGSFTHGKDPLPIEQEAGRTPVPVWTGVENIFSDPARKTTLLRSTIGGSFIGFRRREIFRLCNSVIPLRDTQCHMNVDLMLM